MTGRSLFGADAYVVRQAWWSPLVPAVAGVACVATFLLTRIDRPASQRWLPDPHPRPGDWVIYGASWLMPFAGLCLFVLAAVYVRRVVRGAVAFVAAEKGVYWCPSGRRARGRWFSWEDIAAIEFHPAEGATSGGGAVALCGYPPPGEEELPRIVSTRLGGWRIGRRRLTKALRRFAPDVQIIS